MSSAPSDEQAPAAADQTKPDSPGLTDEEREELKARPIQSEWTDFTEEQLARRVDIGQKLCAFFNRVDHTITDAIRQAYRVYPMWAFYTDNTVLKRVYGVITNSDRTTWTHVHTAAGFLMYVNLTMGGTEASQLTRVERWTEDQKARIKMGASPGLFLDPLGFMHLIRDAASAKHD